MRDASREEVFCGVLRRTSRPCGARANARHSTVLRDPVGIKNGAGITNARGLLDRLLERCLRTFAQLVEGVGEQRSGNRTDTGDFVRFHQSGLVWHQKQVFVAEACEVVQAVRRYDHGGTAIALRFEGRVQPSRAFCIEALPWFIQHDQLQRMAAQHCAQPEQLFHALRQRADPPPVGHSGLATPEGPP